MNLKELGWLAFILFISWAVSDDGLDIEVFIALCLAHLITRKGD
jgi:hypothetical protein